jgi:hypothetical protein
MREETSARFPDFAFVAPATDASKINGLGYRSTARRQAIKMNGEPRDA